MEGKLYPQYTRVYSRSLVPTKTLQEADVSIIQAAIAQGFDDFIQTDLPQIQEILRSQTWIWAQDAPYASDGEVFGVSEAESQEVDEGDDQE